VTIVVGYTSAGSGTSSLQLASVLARSTGEPLVVAVIVATPYLPGALAVDGDYVAPLLQWGESILDRARAGVAADIDASYLVRQAPSIPTGLLDLATEVEASAIVLGSSGKGSLGRISFGSITDRVVHAAPRPVALAPRGFRPGPTARIGRVSMAYAGSDGAHLADVASRLAETVGADLRVVSLVVRPPKEFLAAIEQSAEDLVVDAWVSRTTQTLREQVAEQCGERGARLADSLVVGEGISWSHAMDSVPWAEGEILVVGRSSLAAAARLFLGSAASKIVRSSPVPVLLVPGPGAE
jgi:nucleotide-binding universal stress UspA family protein